MTYFTSRRRGRQRGETRTISTAELEECMDYVHANGIDFAYLEQGSGPLVLL